MTYRGSSQRICSIEVSNELLSHIKISSVDELKVWFERGYRDCQFIRYIHGTIEFYASEEIYKGLLNDKHSASYIGCTTYGQDTPVTIKKDIPQKVENNKEKVLCSRHLWS